ncbi:MAG: FAD:protein FMN transferase [Pirellula sp.]
MKRTALDRFEYTAPTMGTKLRIVVYSESEAAATRAIHAALDEIERLIPILNNYDPTSEVSRLRNAVEEPIEISSDLQRVLEIAIDWHERSNHAFDISLGSVFRLWSDCRKRKELPSADAATQANFTSGWWQWQLRAPARPEERARVAIATEGMIVDTSGLATGYIIDRAFEAMQRTGHESMLIDIGGDIRVGAPPPQTPGWIVEVSGVHSDRRPLCRLVLDACAITTSGDLHQFVEIDGRRYSHIIDPKTRIPLQRRQTATAIADTCVDADAGATALCVLGVEGAAKQFDRMGLREALVLESSLESISERLPSPRFRHLLPAE